MPKYDGSIRINTKIETKDLNSQMMRVSNAIKKDSAALDSLNRKMEEFSQKKIPTEKFAELQRELEKAESEYSKLQARMSQKGAATSEYKALQKDLVAAQGELSKLVARQTDLENMGVPQTGGAWDVLNEQVAAASDRVDDLKEKLQQMENSGKAYTPKVDKAQLDEAAQKVDEIKAKINAEKASGAAFVSPKDTEEFQKMSAKASQLAGNIDVSKRRMAELNAKQKPIKKEFDRMKNSADKAFKTASSGAKKIAGLFSALASRLKGIAFSSKKSAGMFSTFASRLKGIALSLLVFNWITKAFNAMVSGMQKGFSNLAKYSEPLANSFQTLKNSLVTLGNALAAAFAPIVQIAIPYLNALINGITRAITYVAQLIAILGGKSTFIRAKKIQDSYNDSLNGTAEAAKKAAGALAKFDDLDVLQKQDNSGGGGGAGADGGFEEVPIDNKWLKIADWLKEMWENSDFYELGKFLGEKLKEALDNIPWDDIKESARRIAHSIATFINGFIEVEGLGYSIGTTLAQAINTAFEFLNEFVHTIHWDSIGAFIADTLNGFFESIDWDVIYDTFVTGAKGLADAINSFTDWFNWDNVSNTISNLVNTFVDTVYTFFSTADWEAIGANIGQQISKTVKNIDWKAAGEAFSKVATSILEMIKAGLEEIEWDEVGIAIRDFLVGIDWATLLKDVGDIISETLNGLIHTAYAALGGNDEEFTKWQENNRKARDEAGKTYEELGTKAEEYLTRQRKITDPSTWDITIVARKMAQIASEAFDGMMESLSNFCEAAGAFLGEKFTEITENASLKWSEFKIWWDEFWTEILENILSVWENIKLFFAETWESIKETAGVIWTPIKEFFLEIWGEIRDKAVEIWEKVRSTFEEKMNKVKEKSTEIIKKFDDFKTSVKTVFEAVKSKVEETIKPVIDLIQNFTDKIRAAISAVKDFFASGFEKVGEIFGGIFTGGGSSHTRTMSTQPYAISESFASRTLRDIPALASGSVIRGGNPFLAILGDQRAGQTNIEAPIGTIKQAVSEVMAESGGGFRTAKIVLQVNGVDLAQATLQDFLSEASRQGYDLEVIGG